jgi:hypothetical protein
MKRAPAHGAAHEESALRRGWTGRVRVETADRAVLPERRFLHGMRGAVHQPHLAGPLASSLMEDNTAPAYQDVAVLS